MATKSTIVLTALLVAAVAAQSQNRPAGFQDFLRKGDVAALAAALDKDPALMKQRDAQGVPPLFWGAVYGQQAIVELLLARGADPRSSSALGTVLHGAVIGGNPEVIRLLVAKGADANGGGEAGVPPLVMPSGVADCRSSRRCSTWAHRQRRPIRWATPHCSWPHPTASSPLCVFWSRSRPASTPRTSAVPRRSTWHVARDTTAW